MDSANRRTRVQTRMDTTRWHPFAFITSGNVILKDTEIEIYRNCALMTTAIIARLMWNASVKK